MFPPRDLVASDEELSQVDTEVTKLLQKEAILKVNPTPRQFLSKLFIVPKKDGSSRPVVNLRPLNLFISKQRFKMESSMMIRDLVEFKDWMVSIDLKDAFLSIPIHEPHRKLLLFRWRKNLYEFQCLPFGLSSAPRTFTKVMRLVMGLLRSRGIRCIIFIDDVLLISNSKQVLGEVTQETLLLLQHLGFRINWEKSVLKPCQRITYLGFIVDSLSMTIVLPDEKLQNIRRDCSDALSQQSLSVRSLARIIGRMSAATQAILPAPLYYRSLQQLKNMAFRSDQSFETQVDLNPEAQEELRWWIEEISQWNGRAIQMSPPNLTIESDASLLGWGALAEGAATGGLWSPQERHLHINVLELIAGGFAVKTFAKGKKDLHVRLKMDNTAAIAYVNHMGGTRSPTLAKRAKQLWLWCLEKGIVISAEHLPGVANITADFQSRSLQSLAEWRLKPQIFNMILQNLSPCNVDLFATRLNAQLSRYISWRPDPFAIATDALQVQWSRMEGYAFPPFCLIGRCLAKTKTEGSSILLIGNRRCGTQCS